MAPERKACARGAASPARRKSSADLIFLKAAGHQPYGLGMSGELDLFQAAGRNA
jgi:hypothetical protein